MPLQVIPIPGSSSTKRTLENIAAAGVSITPEEKAEIDAILDKVRVWDRWDEAVANEFPKDARHGRSIRQQGARPALGYGTTGLDQAVHEHAIVADGVDRIECTSPQWRLYTADSPLESARW